MSLFKKLFSKKETPITSAAGFWAWFQQHEKVFARAVKQQQHIQKDFFDQLAPKLNEYKDGIFYVTGMADDHTVELILTADGNIGNIVFVEELVAAAPAIPGWLFSALKPALDIKDVNIEMDGYHFNKENIHFYATDHPEYPDEIDITIVYDTMTEEHRSVLTNGVYIFLDNYLGELNFATTIDHLKVTGKAAGQPPLIPIDKLKDFLIWREKEFIEKYDGLRHDTDKDSYAMMEAQLEGGNMLLAVINTNLLQWDRKASHPWILNITISFDGTRNNGMPDTKTYTLLNGIEDAIVQELQPAAGYLNIGRQTANSEREIYFACKDFREPSRVVYRIQKEYAGTIDLKYELYIDKYWQSFSRFHIQ